MLVPEFQTQDSSDYSATMPVDTSGPMTALAQLVISHICEFGPDTTEKKFWK